MEDRWYEGCLLRLFVSEDDRHEGQPLYEWIVERAREAGLAGATVLRGVEGFGHHAHLHTTRILRLAENLPMVIEIMDEPEKIEAFLATIDAKIPEGAVTLERVQMRGYRPTSPPDSPSGGNAS